MKIAIGSDHLGCALKEVLKEHIVSLHHEVVDCGCTSPDPVDYPDIAIEVVKAIKSNDCSRGILICGTGIGMAMCANKAKGIRAAQVHDVYSAQRAALSNDAHIITLGSLIVGTELAKVLVKTWLECFFSGGPSARKIEKIMAIEKLA